MTLLGHGHLSARVLTALALLIIAAVIAVSVYALFLPDGNADLDPAPSPSFTSAAAGDVQPPLPPPAAVRPRTHPPRASRSLIRTPFALLDRVAVAVTAYCWTGNRTASGVWPSPGMAAGNRWPFGTLITVPGHGVVTITDRIGHGSDLDLYYGRGPTCERAAAIFGRRILTVEVLP